MLVAKKGPDIDITVIMNVFEQSLGASLPQQKKQRQYCSHIKRTYGDKAVDLALYALSIQSHKYAPVVTSPTDLYYKAPKVLAFYKRQKQTNVLNLD